MSLTALHVPRCPKCGSPVKIYRGPDHYTVKCEECGHEYKVYLHATGTG